MIVEQDYILTLRKQFKTRKNTFLGNLEQVSSSELSPTNSKNPVCPSLENMTLHSSSPATKKSPAWSGKSLQPNRN